jgi:hypothetical protein
MKTIFFYFALLSCFNSFGQFFQGHVIYNNTFESKLKNISPEKFSQLIGSKQDYYIKDGKYLSVTNGQLMPVQLYINKVNKIYAKSGVSDTIVCIDAEKEGNSIVETSISDSDISILGYKCKKLVMRTANGTSFIFLFSEKLKVEAEDFKGHNYNHWYAYLKKTQSIPLVTIIENAQFKMTAEAKKVEHIKLDDNKFVLPQDAIIKCK